MPNHLLIMMWSCCIQRLCTVTSSDSIKVSGGVGRWGGGGIEPTLYPVLMVSWGRVNKFDSHLPHDRKKDFFYTRPQNGMLFFGQILPLQKQYIERQLFHMKSVIHFFRFR